MNVIIFGGAGFIGSFLTEHFLSLAEVHSVVVYDNFSSGKSWHLKNVVEDPRLKIVEKDIHELELFEPACQFDTAVLLAANPDIARAVTEPSIDFREGTVLTEKVLEFIRVRRIPRLIYSSGSGVYGEMGATVLDENHGPLLPISTYGASKLASEALICSYCHMFGLKASAFRFGNVVGGRQTHGVAYDFLKRLRADSKVLRILGNGKQSKPYVHVSDIVNAISIATLHQRSVYDVYNVAPNSFTTVNEIGAMVINALELSERDVEISLSGGDRGWAGDVPLVRLDTKKIRQLGWVPKLSSSEAVEQSIKEMLVNIREIENGA